MGLCVYHSTPHSSLPAYTQQTTAMRGMYACTHSLQYSSWNIGDVQSSRNGSCSLVSIALLCTVTVSSFTITDTLRSHERKGELVRSSHWMDLFHSEEGDRVENGGAVVLKPFLLEKSLFCRSVPLYSSTVFPALG